MGEISGGGIEDDGLVAGGGLSVVIDGSEAAQGDTEGKAQVIRGGLGIQFFYILWKWISCWAVHSLLSPILS